MNEIHSKYRKNTGKTLSDQDTTLLGGEELLDYALWLEQELLDYMLWLEEELLDHALWSDYRGI